MNKYNLCPSCKKVKTDIHHNLYSVVSKDCNALKSSIPFFNEQNEGSQKIHINLGKKNANCLIHYYSSQKQYDNKFVNVEDSYQNSANKGLKKLDNNGEAILKLDCPQHYIENKKSYMSHVHILVSDKNMTQWKNKLITYSVLCKIPIQILKKHLRNDDRLVINALSDEYHTKSHIPKSFNLYYKDAKKMTPNEIQNKVKEMITDYPKYNTYVKKHKINFLDIPICVYCYSYTCSAGHQLANELYRAGFTNVIDYQNGITEWDSKKTKKKSKSKSK